MKRWLPLILAFALPAAAQNNIRWDMPGGTLTTQAQGGNLLPVFAIPGSAISFLNLPALSVATTYISQSSSTTCPGGSQVTLNGSNACVATADPQGNFGAWFQPGYYRAVITKNGVSYDYDFTISSGGGGGSGTVTTVSVATANGFQGTVANPGTTPSISVSVDSTHVLPVNTGADTNFLNQAGTYSVPAGSNVVTTKGDLFGYSTVPARIPVGANQDCLVADSTQTLGLKWDVCPNFAVGNQAAGVIPLATGVTTIGAQSHMDDGVSNAGIITSTEPVAAPSLISGTPTTAAKAALPSGAHGSAGDESATAGVPAAGVDYWRWDSTSHCAKGSFNGTAESCAATLLTFAAPPAIGDTTPAPTVQSKASAIQPTSVSDCSFNGARYGVDFGGLCSLAEMADTNWIPNATDINGVGKELVSAGAGGGTWAGPGSNYAEYKTNSAMPTLLDIADSSLVNGTPVFGSKNGGGDIFAKGYSYFGERGGTPFSADEGAGVDAAWFGELGPMSATVDASSSGQVIVPNSPSCPWGLPAVQSCQPAKDSRIVDLTTSITGRFTSAPATASISGCSLVTWIEAISTSASIPTMSVYGCTATADVLGFQATVSGSTLTQTAGQPFSSSWNGAQVILNQNQHGTLSACNSTTCTMTPSPGLSGSVNGGLQVLGTNPVLNSITFTGGAGSFAPGDFVCVIGHANSDFGGFPGIIEQSTVVSATGSAGAQTITLNLAKPNGQVFVLKGGCGFVSLDANMYSGYDGTAGYTPGYVALDQSTDGSTMLLVAEAFGGTGTFTIPAGAGEAAKAAVNPAFQATHAYSQGDLIFDGTTNCGGAGCVWSVTAAGTSGGSAPAWTDFPSSIAVGAATAYNVGPATLFHLYPNAARVVSNNYASHSLPNNVTTQVYASSTLEPFASGAFASGDAIRDPNYDAQTLTAHKTSQQCLSGAAESNCDPLLVTMVGPGAVGGGANTNAGVTLLNNNPLATYYANGSLANPQIRLPPDAFHIGGAGQPGVHYNTLSLASPPVGALFDINQPLTGQSSYALLTQHGWSGAITVKNGELDFDNFSTLKRGLNTICDSGGGIPGCGTFSGTVSANTIPRMNSSGTALENSGLSDDGTTVGLSEVFEQTTASASPFTLNLSSTNFAGACQDLTAGSGDKWCWWNRGSGVGARAGEMEFIDPTKSFYALVAGETDGTHGYWRLNSSALFCWSSGDPGGSACDTGFWRDSAGVVDVGNGTAGDASGEVKAAEVLTGTAANGCAINVSLISCNASSVQTVAMNGTSGLVTGNIWQAGTLYSAAGTPLPSCAAPQKGYHATVQDATAPTYLGVYVSGGTVVADVLCNGTNWVTH